MRRKSVHEVKLQSAMEYLTTYGWAILIIAVVLGSLFRLGIFNVNALSPKATPGSCQVVRFQPSGVPNLLGSCTGQLPQYVGSFDGQSSYMSDGTGIDPLSAISFGAWIYTSSPIGYKQFIMGKTKNAVPSFSWKVGFVDGVSGQIRFDIKAGDGSLQAAYSAGVVNANTWTYVFVTFDGRYMKIYINGIQSGSTSDLGSSLGLYDNPTLPVRIAYDEGSSRYYGGLISNVQIYNTSLSASDIQAQYLKGIGGVPINLDNLVGWWPLNGDTNDYSGNGNSGTPTNVVYIRS